MGNAEQELLQCTCKRGGERANLVPDGVRAGVPAAALSSGCGLVLPSGAARCTVCLLLERGV